MPVIRARSRLRGRRLLLLLAVAAGLCRAGDTYPPAAFTDPARAATLAGAFPALDRIFREYASSRHIPGMAWGVVIDGALAHAGFAGVQDLKTQAPVTAASAFRIASMTKSFTALAILRLRDEGRLSLEDPVTRWIPEFAQSSLPTRDSAPVSIRQLLSHSAGLPEDNPWGDQQLAASEADLTRWLEAGFPFSTPPGTRYEYSNLAFGLLGRIVSRAGGMPYETYVRTRILEPLHMTASTFRFEAVAPGARATGYRLKPDGGYAAEPPLPQGAFGAAGGLITTTEDLGRYVAFHLAAWPARDAPDAGPVRRSSVRQMSELATPANLVAARTDGHVHAVSSGYGFGLRVASDCRFAHLVAHGGGLPGFGSYMQWLPDYGVGLFALATLTYSGPSEAISQGWDALLQTGALRPRTLPASGPLEQMRQPLFELWRQWDDSRAAQIGAMNLLIDFPGAQRRADIEALKAEVGACPTAGAVQPENWLRGQFNLACARGTVGVFYTLSPTTPPKVQHLKFQKLDGDAQRLVAPTGAPAGVACTD